MPAFNQSLVDVLTDHLGYLGTHASSVNNGHDAKWDLSVQVHPDDEYAKEYENGSLGKTEMWYVLDARRDSELVYGFNRDVDADQVEESIEDRSIVNLLNYVEVHKNDLFYTLNIWMQ